MPKNTVLSALLLGLSLAGCAMAQGSMPASVATTSKGSALVDARGMTLYDFDKDAPNAGKSACNGPCAANWPAFKATAAAAPAGWSKITRDDGIMQWAYKGRPLYTFAKDTMPADTKGDGFLNGAWHIAQP